MGLQHLNQIRTMSTVEQKFSKKFEETASNPKHRGAWYQEDATEKGLALVQAKHKDSKLYWLVDVKEDRIYSARFFAYGGKVSLAIGETLCSMVEGLTIQEACSLFNEDIEKQLRDDPEISSVPQDKSEAFEAVGKLLEVIGKEYPAAKAVAEAAVAVKKNQPAPSFTELSMAEQAWLGLTKDEQKNQIDLVLDEKVRQALMNDGGNVEVVDIIEGQKVVIQYQGACGSCGSSVGGTLSFIEQALRTNIYKELVVIPNTHI
ncbi:MAG: NifU family protein [Nitrospinota bacterium]|nr:NifU family protein [Nitrospinota bacterium]